MPVPRHSMALASVQLAQVGECEGVTELRMHGVGGSPPGAILGDLAPEQASGDRIAGFYRSGDHRASPADYTAGRDADRHVECYSWGGLTSRSKVRVLWLALLPFLFGNLAGWMCSARTRESAWRFRLHRLAYGLGALALTVNAALVAVMISADVLAYQTARAGLAGHQWWLAPLGWHFIAGHPARQVTFGVLVVVLFVLALTWLASGTWRYEAVRPPYKVTAGRKDESRTVTAAALPDGLADDEFWDGESSVRLVSWLHVGVAGGFVAIVLGITAKALTASPHFIALAWIAIGLGGATAATAVAYICWDAVSTPPVRSLSRSPQAGSGLSDTLRGWLRFLPVPAAAALLLAGVFAWLQPGGSGRAAELPGMATVIRWTALAIAVAVAVALISMLLGLPGRQETLTGGPWVTLMLGFAALNIVLLGADIWVAHLVGPVTSNAAAAVSRPQGKIYLPYVITSGVPLLVWAAVLAVLAFGLTQGVRWLRQRRLPEQVARQYQDDAMAFTDPLTEPRNVWYWSGLDPGQSKGWEQKIARAQFVGRAPHDATWLLWGTILAQLVTALCVWQLRVQPPVLIRNIGIAIAGLALPTVMAFLYSAWNDPAKRRTIGVLWDVGTFWPRSYHPLSPPCYTERAIPELQRRMWWLHDNGGQVVLVAHSQGAMLATAALVQPGCRPEYDHPALITFGSPVCKLYSWGFPAYVDRKLLEPLVPEGTALLNDWRNFYYPTDPIGGSVAPDLSAAGSDPVNQEFLDPAECYYVYGQPPPAPQGHSGYWADPRVWERINAVAAAAQAIPAAAPAAIQVPAAPRQLAPAPVASRRALRRR